MIQHPALTATVAGALTIDDCCTPQNPVFTEGSPSTHQADDDISACKGWRFAAFPLLDPCRC
jgi:hypothetical protein